MSHKSIFNCISCANRIPRFLYLLVFTALLIVPFPGPLHPLKPQGVSTWGYIVPGSIDLTGKRHYNRTNLSNYSVLGVTGFSLLSDGTLKTNGLASVKQLRAMNLGSTEIVPVISFKSVDCGIIILRNRSIRINAIKSIVSLLSTNSFQSLHFDFEYLPPAYASLLALFLKEVREYCSLHHFTMKTTMAIFPQVDFPEKWSRFHDLSRIAPYLDEIVLMCYDYHRPDTAPGPVTDLSWAERNIAHALVYFRPEQVWLGIPAYGYSWTGHGKASAVSSRAGALLYHAASSSRHTSGTMCYLKKSNRGDTVAYIADAGTRSRLTTLAQRSGLRGTALWRIGFEELP